ncbi:hypothetical protein SAMN04488012_103150 [Palleronia salina]|uniref:Argininosuccinate lyase n=2 Tax=Palleronia TaxID=315422 RepID=A0A1M6EMK1_9RHOB|nr:MULTISPECIES: hypothetical protein [Palleronia]SEN75475.1 hypothetical protein SAMN04488011_10663 [Palleronia pelagia]SHI86646.1 hypothetical protein SAMN04488012_103150 [Palleronia salina]
MTRIAALIALATLAACGADAPPEPVVDDPARRGGIAVSGTAEIGISGGSF